jgi:hypothetical protein
VVGDAHQRVGEIDRPRERHVDLPQRLKRRAALDAGGFVQLDGDRLERLAQQEDSEGAGHVRQADRDDRVAQAQQAHRPVVLDEQHVGRDHELDEHEREEKRSAGKGEPGEGVGGQRAEHQLPGEDHRAQHHGVHEVAGERRGMPRPHEVLQRERRAQHEPRGELARVKRRPEGVGEGEDPERSQQPRPRGLEASASGPGAIDGRAHR